MRLKNLPARAASFLLAAVAAAGIFSPPAFAAANAGPPQTIDFSRTGSITIHKHAEDGCLNDEAELTPDQLAEYIQAHPDELAPMPGVVFRYLKIADLVQYTKRTEDETGATSNVVTLGYAVDEAAAEFLALDEADADAIADNTLCYDARTLDAALNRKTATQTEVFVSEQEAAYMPVTGDAGTAAVSDLPLGLYLVCEWSYPATATADGDHCAPFLVSLPSTNQDGSGWSYAVDVTPKNLLSTLRNDKVILGTGGNETKEYDAEINEAVRFLIRSDVPSAIGKLQTYKIVDALSAGLTYDEGTYTVYGAAADGSRTQLVDGQDYVFIPDAAGNTMEFDFTPSSLADSEGWAAYDSVEIYYTAHLNENAVIGGEGNPNELKTVYSRSTYTDATEILTPDESPRVYTYAIHAHKVDGDTGASLAGVTFELQDADGNAINVSEQTPGVYYLDPTGSAVPTTNAEGSILIKGVQAATYYLKETSAADGFLLPANKIEVVISSNENCYTQDAAGTYALADPELTYCTDLLPCPNYFILPLTGDLQQTVPAGTYVCFGTISVLTQPDGGQVEMYRADKLEWSSNYAMGGQDDADTGIVKLEITNNRIPLPKTGTDGDFWTIVIGSCVVCAGAILFAVSFLGKRRKNSSDK